MASLSTFHKLSFRLVSVFRLESFKGERDSLISNQNQKKKEQSESPDIKINALKKNEAFLNHLKLQCFGLASKLVNGSFQMTILDITAYLSKINRLYQEYRLMRSHNEPFLRVLRVSEAGNELPVSLIRSFDNFQKTGTHSTQSNLRQSLFVQGTSTSQGNLKKNKKDQKPPQKSFGNEMLRKYSSNSHEAVQNQRVKLGIKEPRLSDAQKKQLMAFSTRITQESLKKHQI